MAAINPVNLNITRNPNNPDHFFVDVSYIVSANGADLDSGQRYHELCELIGDDTPGDGTDDSLLKMYDAVTAFSGTAAHFQRALQQEVPWNTLNEDNAVSLFEKNEIRARVTLTPLPASRESNQVVLGGLVSGSNQ